MGHLIDDLLNFAQLGRRELCLESADLGQLLREVIVTLEPLTEGRAIEWRIGSLPDVMCDPGLIKIVLTNLLSNALKFTRGCTTAVIQIGTKEVRDETVVFIGDNGVGFDPRYADKLFGVFQRLHRPEDFEGTGIGLATVQRILDRHGSRIWAESNLDKGAMFYFTLPGAQEIVASHMPLGISSEKRRAE
jgi:light-regulated signal transduction histidine kinase (bacteriophytochrome)